MCFGGNAITGDYNAAGNLAVATSRRAVAIEFEEAMVVYVRLVRRIHLCMFTIGTQATGIFGAIRV